MSREERIRELWDAVELATTPTRRTAIDQAEFDRGAAGAFPGGARLEVGDVVLHPKEGRCTVQALENHTVVLASEEGHVVEVPSHEAVFSPDSIEAGGVRVFSMSFESDF